MMRRNRIVWSLLASIAVVGVAIGCGGSGDAQTAAEPATEQAPAAPAAEEAEAPSGAPLDTARFSTVLPDGWEVMSDAMDKMGMMTLAEKGSGGAVGVYLKFEGNGNWDGDPLAEMEAFSAKQDGTPAEMVTINGIDWAKTSYRANGVDQTMYVTKHDGTKVTATVLGDANSPAVEAIMGSFTLK